MRETESIISETKQVVTIGNREADFYDLFAFPRRLGSEFLIRAMQNGVVQKRGIWGNKAGQIQPWYYNGLTYKSLNV